jgi:hypothetical protein
MLLTGENCNIGIKAHSIATLSTTNPAWAGLVMNMGPHGKKPATNHLSHDMALIGSDYDLI